MLRAGEWFQRSGIQSQSGGVARYYRSDLERNQAISTEITGYAASTFVLAGQLDRAQAAARFLLGACDTAGGVMPFETDPALFTYFFDSGIIVRGLLAVWRETGNAEYLDCACRLGRGMAGDFRASDGSIHPILALPDKNPVERDPLRWSQSPGCYQLKAAMAWWDLWEITGDKCYRDLYQTVREESIRTEAAFLPGHPEVRKVVDRLHAYLYFLEGLLPAPCETLQSGIERVAGLVREHAAVFERSDVYAQLLRIRVYADATGMCKLDRAAASWEADRLLEFSATSADPRVAGGFYFGRSAGKWEPYVNPVSTGFAMQALAMWSGDAPVERHLLI